MLPTGFASLAIDAMAVAVTRRRFTVNGWQPNGVFDETSGVSSATIKAVIQAPSAEDMRLLPEGERVEAYVTIWTRADLRVADETAGTRSDEIIGANGIHYRIVRLTRRTEAGFNRAIARLAKDDPERHL